ncbi:MAG: hypothetical protein QM749_17950 [Aquabacterium sp.]
MKKAPGRLSKDHLLILLFGILCAILISLDNPLHGDENHFYRTLVQFGQSDISVIIKDYNQVTGPVFFSLYGFIGRYCDFSKEFLRFVNLLPFVFFLLLLRSTAQKTLAKEPESFQALLFSLINPYMVGIAIYLYTDGINMLAIYLFYYAVVSKRMLVLIPATALALCTRQYSVAAIAASSLYILTSRQYELKSILLAALYVALGCIPFICLYIIWGGIAPKQGLAHWVPNQHVIYHWDYITTYVAFMTIYALPVIFYKRAAVVNLVKETLGAKGAVCVALLSLYAFVFPTQISEAIATTSTRINSVGYVHEAMKHLPIAHADEALIWLFFLFGIGLLAAFFIRDFKHIRRMATGFNFFLSINILFFLLMMPLSYQVWEKYLIVMMPLFVIRILNADASQD